MQQDTITLALTHDTTTIDAAYRRAEEYNGRSVYIAPDHETAVRHIMGLYRTPAKPTSTFRGVKKASVKITQDVVVDDRVGGTVQCPAIAAADFSLPEGMTDAQRKALVVELAAAILHDAMMDDLLRLGLV